MQITRFFTSKKANGGQIMFELTDEEMEAIYRIVEHQYKLQDAENALLDNWGNGREEDILQETSIEFFEKWGFHLAEAIDEKSNRYILEDIVEQFERLADCNVPENSTWEAACRKALEEAKAARF